MSKHEEVEPHDELAMMKRSRATPLRPSIWMTGVLVWATVIALFLRVPTWAGIFLCSLTGISFLLYLVFYVYLMLYDRELLRRERVRVEGQQVSERGSLMSASTRQIGAQTQAPVIETPAVITEQASVVRRGDS